MEKDNYCDCVNCLSNKNQTDKSSCHKSIEENIIDMQIAKLEKLFKARREKHVYKLQNM